MAITLSGPRHELLGELMTLKSRYFSIQDAARWDQRTFGSFLIKTATHQPWVAYVGGKGFKITDAAIADWSNYHNAKTTRNDPSRPLTHYFDPAAYGLEPEKIKRLLVIPKKGAA
jgi:hypothetical protein